MTPADVVNRPNGKFIEENNFDFFNQVQENLDNIEAHFKQSKQKMIKKPKSMYNMLATRCGKLLNALKDKFSKMYFPETNGNDLKSV